MASKGFLGREHKGTKKATTSPRLVEIYWAAGFIEGEGCFSARTWKTRPNKTQRVSASQKEREPLERLLSSFGGCIRESFRNEKGKRVKKGYIWYVYGARVRGVMFTLYPLMSTRRQGQIRKGL